MSIAIGSLNKVKIQAVEEVISDYDDFAGLPLTSLNVPSNVCEQPMSLAETVKGAKNRAINAFEATPDCQYAFGIESGLMEVAGSKSGFFDLTICAIYDGTDFFIGQSCAFELPQQVIQLVLHEKMDLGQACFHSKLTEKQALGASEGAIGLLTNGRITRKDYTKHAIIMALTQIENAHLFLSV